MYEKFEVSNFRCFSELRLSKLARINLFAGRNNVGKTTLLEALFIHSSGFNVELAFRTNAIRGIEPTITGGEKTDAITWQTLFYRMNTQTPVHLTGTWKTRDSVQRWEVRLRMFRDGKELPELWAKLTESMPQLAAPTSHSRPVLELETVIDSQTLRSHAVSAFPGTLILPAASRTMVPAFFRFSTARLSNKEIATWFGNLVREKKEDALLECTQTIEPRIRRIVTVVQDGEPLLYADLGQPPLLPLAVLGDGVMRLTCLALGISNVAGGIALVDEIENGFHHTLLSRLWDNLAWLAEQFDVQLFATTHSLECIEAAHKALTQRGDYDFLLHRLEQLDGRVQAVTYDSEVLQAALEAELEVR